MRFAGSLPNYQEEVDKLLPSASELVHIDLKRFEEMANGVIEDELQAHYFCYINSCVVSKILKQRSFETDYVAGYSMGLYGGLFHAGVVNFESGLLLMHDIYNIALGSLDEKKYRMGVIVGLNSENVEKLISENCDNVDIIDISNEHVVNVTGVYDEVVSLIDMASKQAITTKMLPITLPYHSSFMKNATGEIGKYLKKVQVKDPQFGIVSCVNQKTLTTAQDVKDELYCNVNNRINWLKTMQKLLELKVEIFIECGTSKSLNQLAKFINGNYKIYHIDNLPN